MKKKIVVKDVARAISTDDCRVMLHNLLTIYLEAAS